MLVVSECAVESKPVGRRPQARVDVYMCETRKRSKRIVIKSVERRLRKLLRTAGHLLSHRKRSVVRHRKGSFLTLCHCVAVFVIALRRPLPCLEPMYLQRPVCLDNEDAK